MFPSIAGLVPRLVCVHASSQLPSDPAHHRLRNPHIPINASDLSPYTSLTAFDRGAPTNYITDLIVPHQILNAQITTNHEALELIIGVAFLGGLKGG